jgi:hypothetical protein
MSAEDRGSSQTSRRFGATPILALAMAASAIYMVVLGSKLSFLLDDWTYIVGRRGFSLDVFMEPANEHFVAGPVVVWKLLLETFGIGSTVPYRIVSTAMFLLGAWFMFVLIRRRIGEWPALLATIPVLFLGAAFDDFLWFASITFLGSMACGLGMLVALERRDRTGDLLACLWLVGSLLFSSLWLAFAIGAALDIFLRRRERPRLRRIYVVAVPVVLYALWWLGWGHDAESALSIHNLATTPLFVLDSIAAAIAALLGLAIPIEGTTAPNGLDWGRPLAILLIALAAWRMYRMERIPRSLWVLLAVGLSFWILGGLDVKPGRTAAASRYQYPGAVFVLLVGAELLRGARLDRRLLGPALAVIAAAVIANAVFLNEAFESYRSTSQLERADLAAVEIARDSVEPAFVLSEDIADTGYVHIEAAPYLAARDAYGSPAYSEGELANSPAPARVAADKVLAAALGVELVPVSGPPPEPGPLPRAVDPPSARLGTREGCLLVNSSAAAVVELPAGGVTVRAPDAGQVRIRLRRFASSFPVAAGALSSGAWGAITIPTDRSNQPWQIKLIGSGAGTVCANSRP